MGGTKRNVWKKTFLFTTPEPPRDANGLVLCPVSVSLCSAFKGWRVPPPLSTDVLLTARDSRVLLMLDVALCRQHVPLRVKWNTSKRRKHIPEDPTCLQPQPIPWIVWIACVNKTKCILKVNSKGFLPSRNALQDYQARNFSWLLKSQIHKKQG